MGLFSFGKSKQSSNSTSASNTYVDSSQQPFLNDIRNQAQQLNSNGMPVEGVAGINPNLAGALQNQYSGGNMQAMAGTGLMNSGSALAGGQQQALRFGNQAMMGSPNAGSNFAFGAGNQYAGGTQGFNAAQGGGANFGMANNMGNSASTAGPASMNAASNSGFNINNVGNYINNDVLQGQIDASTRDITRNLQQNTLPSIQGQAAGSGNSGSSRVGNMMGTAMGMANESIGDISANMRGNAFNTGLGIEAGRASQNAQFQQGANQANANFMQNANQFNAGQQNQLRSQGFNMGGDQLQNNLNRQQQADQYNAGQFNQARQFGTGIGQGAFNTNQQNQQFGADMSARMGLAGVNNMQTGAGMFNTGVRQQLGAGQYGRDYEQQLYNQQFRQAMSPYNSLEFYNQLVGAPNNLSNASSTSSSKGSSMNLGFGMQ